MIRSGLSIALALIVAVNGIVLAGALHNRSGEPDARVELTERELRLEGHSRENSAVSLKLTLQRQHDDINGPFPWLERGKLEQLGFDCRTPPDGQDAGLRYDRALPRRVWLVLEYEGKAWQAWRSEAQRRLTELASRGRDTGDKRKAMDFEAKRLRWESLAGSRLFAIDAGNDPASLRQRYPDRTRCIITPALVRIQLLRAHDQEPHRSARLAGYVERLLTDSIQVPRDRRGALTSLAAPRQEYSFSGQSEKVFAPRYRVTLNYGKRHEPWVTAVQPLPPARSAAQGEEGATKK